MSEKIVNIDQSELPGKWFNPIGLFEKPFDPPINPQTEQPIAPEQLKKLFPERCIDQEISADRWIDIPKEIIEGYKIWRPTPLCRASNLEKKLDTPAKIFFKYEGISPPGSHKPNTALPQAFYAQQEGTTTLTTETGAGQWGSALSFATRLFDLKCKVYMVKVSYEQKPYRRSMIEGWNAQVIPSPSDQTEVGRSFLEEDPDTLGSLGMAISEAIETAFSDKDIKYSLGSVLNHVLIHQSIVGLETKLQLEKIGEFPDVLIGCTGGGSNFGGLLIPFLPDIIERDENISLIAAEPTACPTFTKGEFKYDFADCAETTPKIKMLSLGHEFVPPGIHAGGLRYHGMAPLLCRLYQMGILEARAFHQTDVFEDALTFAGTEGYVPAPETAHAIKAAVEVAKEAKRENTSPTVVLNFSGHGHFDMGAYDDYLAGKLQRVEY